MPSSSSSITRFFQIASPKRRIAPNQIGRIHHEDSLGFLLIRERLRSVAADPHVARQYYANLLKNGGGKTIQERYGRDVADIELKNPAPAIADLQELVREYPKVTAILRRAWAGIPGEQSVQRIDGGS